MFMDRNTNACGMFYVLFNNTRVLLSRIGSKYMSYTFSLEGTTKLRNGHFLAKWACFWRNGGKMGNFWAKWACFT